MSCRRRNLETSIAPLLALVLLLCAPSLRAEPAEAALRLPPDPLAGRTLFETKRCLGCHGIGGAGARVGQRLDEGGFGGTFLEFGAAMWNHVPTMSAAFESNGIPWPELTAPEANRLIEFLYFIDYLGRPGEADRGRSLFQDKGCNGCHSVGGPVDGNVSDLGDLPQYASPLYVAERIWNHGPAMLESMLSSNIPPPRFEDGDLADISAYIRRESLTSHQKPLLARPGNPYMGRELFRRLGCARCHGDDARGGDGGPDLTGFDLRSSAESIAGRMWNHALAMNRAMHDRGIAWPELEVSELADITAFLYFLPFQDPGGDPDVGAERFSSRSCADCHEHGGSGAPSLEGGGAAESPSSLLAALWSHAPVMRKAVLQRGSSWPRLTGEDLRDIYAYLQNRAAGPAD